MFPEKDILNGLQWTARLEEQFERNRKEDDEILWQYFGSQTGFMRTYPGIPYITLNFLDFIFN